MLLNTYYKFNGYTFEDIFLDIDKYNVDVIPKILIYLGAIKFIITHFDIDISTTTRNFCNIEFNEIRWDNLDKIDIDVFDKTRGIIKTISHLILVVIKWMYNLLVCNHITITNRIIKYTKIDLCTTGFINSKFNHKHNITIWKTTLLIMKPFLGIINGFGKECQSVINNLFPPKIALFTNHFFTKGIRDIYLNLNSLEIDFDYSKEATIHDIVKASLINKC